MSTMATTSSECRMRFDIGFLGGGQLARMSIQAAQRMGLNCLSLDPGQETPASDIAASIVGALDDPESIQRVFEACERVTFENEFIPASAVRSAIARSGRKPDCLLPSADCLETVQDKLAQRNAYALAGVPSPTAVELDAEGKDAIERIGFPMVIKSRFGGYDGKGTRYAKDKDSLASHADLFIRGGWMAEQFVKFKREVAVMVCRSERQTVCFPTMVTEQKNHVCDFVYPCDSDASRVAIRAIDAVKGYGLFGVELFETHEGSFLVNEIAPRPHNSGHYTLDWGGISQFEAHVRLVMGLSVPAPQGQPTCMANLLGIEGAGDYRRALRAVIERDPGVHVHWYGKAESRPGRKMGHLNTVGIDCLARARHAQALFYEAWARG